MTNATSVFDGVHSALAAKAPVATATTAEITLSGHQTVGGILTTEGMRVLVKNQSNAALNGIYNASSGAWSRSPDFDGSRDIANGTLVYDAGGDVQYRVVCNTPVVVGTNTLTFQRVFFTSPVSVLDFGAVGDGVTDNLAAFEAAFTNRPSGAAVYVPPGTYDVSGRIDIALTSPFELILAPGAVIFGNAASSDPVVTLRGGASRYRVTVRGGQIDNSARTYTLGAQSGTALELIDTDDFLVGGVVFGNKALDWTDGFGDSGITATECQRGTITGCTFYGQPDLGVYITGGASAGTTDDYGTIIVSGNRFHRCNAGISSKRSQPQCVWTGNTFYECRTGVAMLEASSLPAGVSSVISDNVFKFCESSAIRIQGDGACVINGNLIEDFGFNRAVVSGVGKGIWLRGASRCVGTGNAIRFKDWTSDTNHTAIELEQYNDGVTTYTPTHNHIADTLIYNVFRAIREGASVGQNFFLSQTIIGATTILTVTNAGTLTQFNDGTSAQRTFIGPTERSRVNANSFFVSGLRTLDNSTVAAVPANFVANRYYPVNFNGTIAYVPAMNTVW